MKQEEFKTVVSSFQESCENAFEIAKTALRNKKSLSGNNYYADKFHEVVVEISIKEKSIMSLAGLCNLDASSIERLARHTQTIKSISEKLPKRREALRKLRSICQVEIVPNLEGMTANPIPKTEQVLPLSVVEGTRGYIEKVILQANGCYEHQWYDACSVMVRRFVETLIIEVYEAQGKASEIKKSDDNFMMLSGLIDKILEEKNSLNLSRETKQVLPEIKKIGDRSAHKRRYSAKKHDIDKIRDGLRILADDLLHLASLK